MRIILHDDLKLHCATVHDVNGRDDTIATTRCARLDRSLRFTDKSKRG